MGNTVTNYQNPLQTVKHERTIKLLQFSVGSLQLSLPVDSVRKVLRHVPVHGSGTGAFGIAHIEDTEVTVIDLHKRLFKVSQFAPAGQKGYLILARDSSGETLGIWVTETPTLLDVGVSRTRVLPESYRRSDTLAIASHVTVLQQGESSITVFLLDVDRLIDRDSM
jgi:purine-binding chemotaxis protein CheW